MSQQSPLRRRRRFTYAHTRSTSTSSNAMEVPRLSLDTLSLAHALVRTATDSLAQLRARPRVETAVKCSGGVAAALLALKYAKSLRSACAIGMLAGVFAHSLYADVLRKKPAIAATTTSAAGAADGDADSNSDGVVDTVATQRRSLVDREVDEEGIEDEQGGERTDAMRDSA